MKNWDHNPRRLDKLFKNYYWVILFERIQRDKKKENENEKFLCCVLNSLRL